MFYPRSDVTRSILSPIPIRQVPHKVMFVIVNALAGNLNWERMFEDSKNRFTFDRRNRYSSVFKIFVFSYQIDLFNYGKHSLEPQLSQISRRCLIPKLSPRYRSKYLDYSSSPKRVQRRYSLRL